MHRNTVSPFDFIFATWPRCLLSCFLQACDLAAGVLGVFAAAARPLQPVRLPRDVDLAPRLRNHHPSHLLPSRRQRLPDLVPAHRPCLIILTRLQTPNRLTMWRGNLRQVACQLAPAVPRRPESARVRDRPDLLRQVRGATMLTNPHSCQRFQTCWTRHFEHANCKLPSRQRSLGLTQVRRSRSIAEPAGAGLQTLSFIHCGSSSSLGIFS